MVPVVASLFVLMPVFLSGTQAGENGPGEKIIIHVPYEIHSHHHTHTNYKLIKEEKNVEEPIHKKESNHFSNEIKTSNSIIATDTPYNINFAESQFKPQIFHNFNDQSLISKNNYRDLDDAKEENLQGLHGEHFEGSLINLPTTVTTLVHSIHPTSTNFQFAGDDSYLHSFSTDGPLLPHYPSQAANPTYQVEEKQEINERLHQNISPAKQNPMTNLFARNFARKNQYPLRTEKSFPTINTSSPKGKAYSKSNDEFLSIPNTKTFFQGSTPKVSKTFLKNGEEYEHIGYLVVGKNTHKFVGVNNKE